MPKRATRSAEKRRLEEDAQRKHNWKRWGPYLSERQWGTVREDYSPDGAAWDFFPHDHARSRAYRWGEDGLLGFTDREGRLCFALAVWNEHDSILKERLFGLVNAEGNHGEDVKEYYFYLDSTPTHSYCKALYKYPQAAFPYAQLIEENHRRSRLEPEFELGDTGIFDDNRYFDITAEYAKAAPDDICIRLTVANRGPQAAPLHLLPTLWFRNTWSWGCLHEGCWEKPYIEQADSNSLRAWHPTLDHFRWTVEPVARQDATFLFTENETNVERLFGGTNATPYVKDAWQQWLIEGHKEAVNPVGRGTKAAAYYHLQVPAAGEVVLRFRLRPEEQTQARAFVDFDKVLAQRIREADEFYAEVMPPYLADEKQRIARQAYAGLEWSKQFYYYVVEDWLHGDPDQPPPPPTHGSGRNNEWTHVFNRDVLLMPDKWEYPWYAAWDLAFHTVAIARTDPQLAKEQLILLLREWYMHPNGQLPAYEYNFYDVNPPVHAWAAWRVYKISAPRGQRDRLFLRRVFQKLLLNFTWWINRKDVSGRNLFAGGFLGLDNIGVFDRSQPLPHGGALEQADGTAWMAFYCSTMLAMALELAREDEAYEDVASKFFEHFVAIVNAMNTLGGSGLWHEEDGFYYDRLLYDGTCFPLRARSMVGLIPLFAVEILDDDVIKRLPGFAKRMKWFMENRQELASHIVQSEDVHSPTGTAIRGQSLLAIPAPPQLKRVLQTMLDPNEFLSPFGIRSLSRAHAEHPFSFDLEGTKCEVRYEPGEGESALFGGNSNWRGPIWFPVNYLLIEALERYGHFYGDALLVECPVGSGQMMNLGQVSREIARRLTHIFLPDNQGHRPWHGADERFATDPHWKDLMLFHEYFHGETGRGLGASHQTGWTALIAEVLRGTN